MVFAPFDTHRRKNLQSLARGAGKKLKKGEFYRGESFRGVEMGLLTSDVYLL